MVGPSSYISKFLVTLLFILIGWYIYMDTALYMRIQNYPIDRSYHFNTTTTTTTTADPSNPAKDNKDRQHATNMPAFRNSASTNPISTAMSFDQMAALSTIAYYNTNVTTIKYEDVAWISCDINPLCHVTIKALLLDHTNHYLFAPMATIFDNIVGFSKSSWITPNMISFFHVFVAIAAGRLVASDSLSYRRLGVVIFQFRTFLDDLDGHVARQKKHIRGERSEIGTAGYYIDGLCDGLGCIALMIGIFIHLKNNPPRRGYTQLQAILPVNDTKNSDSGVVYKVKVTTKKVARKVLCISGQLLLSSTGWNRYIALYQDILERNDVTSSQFIRQIFIFKSEWFFCVAWLWRVVNVHAILHCLLLSIFCDKLWEFLRAIQYIGYVVLLVIICITEMHVLDVQNFIFHSLTGNNTAV